jgi:CarD family transcriptional regulator
MTQTSAASLEKFQVNDNVVYPSHGVGVITDIEKQTVAGVDLECLVIKFEKDKMTLKVPVGRAKKAGLRQLSSNKDIDDSLLVLKGKAKVEKGMWSKRAQRYEEKIYSGDVSSIAEVLRDLHKNVDDPSRSYSERVIYESAFERFVNEYAASKNMSIENASRQVLEILDEAKMYYQEVA